LTRYTLLPNAERDLSNIQSLFDENDNWQNYFKKEDADNITYDLRAILELIDKLAEVVASKVSSAIWKITFKDTQGNELDSKNITPWGGITDYEFTGFGRPITLTIDGKQFKFHTIRDGIMEDENLNIVLPKQNLRIKRNGVVIGSFSNVYMDLPDDVPPTIDIIHDYNFIPATVSGLGAVDTGVGYQEPYVSKEGNTYIIHLDPY
jgi:hypothetical protein